MVNLTAIKSTICLIHDIVSYRVFPLTKRDSDTDAICVKSMIFCPIRVLEGSALSKVSCRYIVVKPFKLADTLFYKSHRMRIHVARCAV